MNNRLKIVVMFSFIVLFLLNHLVHANPIPSEPSPPEPMMLSFQLTFLINLPFNLLFLTLLSYFVLVRNDTNATLIRERRSFLFFLGICTILLTFLGSLIDEFLVKVSLYNLGHIKYYASLIQSLISDLLIIGFSLLLIFMFTYGLVFSFLRFSKNQTIVISVGIVILNVIFWIMQIIEPILKYMFIFSLPIILIGALFLLHYLSKTYDSIFFPSKNDD